METLVVAGTVPCVLVFHSYRIQTQTQSHQWLIPGASVGVSPGMPLPNAPDGSVRMSLRMALVWARTDPHGSAYSDVIFAIVPTAAEISEVRAKRLAGVALTPEEVLVHNTMVSREDITKWFVQEAIRVTRWLVPGSGPLHVESAGAASYAMSLEDTQYLGLLNALCHAGRHAHYRPKSGLLTLADLPVYTDYPSSGPWQAVAAWNPRAHMANGYVAGGNTEFRNDLNLFFRQGLAVIFAKLFENSDPMDAASGGPPAGPAAALPGESVAENDRLMTDAGRDGAAQAALTRHVPDVGAISFRAITSFFACPHTPAAVKRACFHGGISQRLSTTPPGLVSQRLEYFMLDRLAR